MRLTTPLAPSGGFPFGSDAAPYAPSSQGLALWLDALDTATLFQDAAMTTPVTNAYDPVGAWADKSGAGRHATQAASMLRPSYRPDGLNGRPSVEADGVDDWLASDGMAGLLQGNDTPFTMTAVFRTATTAGDQRAMGAARNGGSDLLQIVLSGTASRFEAFRRDAANISHNAVGGTLNTSPRVLSWTFDGAVSTLFLEGVTIGTQADTADVGALVLNTFTLFARRTSTAQNLMQGHIGAALVYVRALPTFERIALERYLGARHGVTVQ